MKSILEFTHDLITTKRQNNAIINESKKSVLKASNLSAHNTTIHYIYNESFADIEQYNNRCKNTLSDFRKRLDKYLSTFAKDHLEVIKDDFEYTDLKEDGYEIPAESAIRSKIKISHISFGISSKGECYYFFEIIADKIPSGKKIISVKTTFKIKYDKENNWYQSAGDKYTDEYTMDTDYHRSFETTKEYVDFLLDIKRDEIYSVNEGLFGFGKRKMVLILPKRSLL